jgi:hypothetical protein
LQIKPIQRYVANHESIFVVAGQLLRSFHKISVPDPLNVSKDDRKD